MLSRDTRIKVKKSLSLSHGIEFLDEKDTSPEIGDVISRRHMIVIPYDASIKLLNN